MSDIKRHIPNLLTVLRVALAPIVLFGPFTPQIGMQWALIAFIIASLTDWLDGYLARKWSVQSQWGAALDHTADKILVLSAIIGLAVAGILTGWGLAAGAVILYRELYVSSLRESLAGKNIKMPVSNIGKWKTTFQMLSLGLLLGSTLVPLAGKAGFACLWLATILSVHSAWIYTRAAAR